MSDTTVKAARRLFLREVPKAGYTAAITGLTTTTITLKDRKNSKRNPKQYQNKILFRSDASDLDVDGIRYGGAYSAGAITIEGENYTDVTATDEFCEVWHHMELHPREQWAQMATDALDALKVRGRIPLAHGPADYDMQASATTAWPATNGSTSIQVTASEVFMAKRSRLLTDGGAGTGYLQQLAAVRVGQARKAAFFTIAKSDAGTSQLVIRSVDATGAEATEETVPFTQEAWLLLKKYVSFDADHEGWAMRIANATASGATDVQFAWGVNLDELDFYLPSWIDHLTNVVGISVARPQARGREDDTWLAGSIKYERLEEGVDFQFHRFAADANPHLITILKPEWLKEPLFLELDMPWSAPYGVAVSFEDEDDTTGCPMPLFIAQMKILAGKRYPGLFPGLMAEGTAEKLNYLARNRNPRTPRDSSWGGAFNR